MIPWKTKKISTNVLESIGLTTLSSSSSAQPSVKPQLPDWKLKTLEKKYSRPYFSQTPHAWEMDLMEVVRDKQWYLFIININTRYLVVYPTNTRRLLPNIFQLLQRFFGEFKCDSLRGDGEFNKKHHSSLGDEEFSGKFNDRLKSLGIKTYFPDSKFINKNRSVDRVMRTIRDGFGLNTEQIRDNEAMQRMVKIYNHTPHSAYNNLFSPIEVQNDFDLEAMYIRSKIAELHKIKLLQSESYQYVRGNILFVHIDRSKTQDKFTKARRVFDTLAIFHKYFHGNVMVRLMRTYGSKYDRTLFLNPIGNYIVVPIHHTQFAYKSFDDIPPDVKYYFRIF